MSEHSGKVTHKYLSDLVSKVPPSGIRKFFDLVVSADDIISLGVGEPDYVTAWPIREAAIRSIERGYTMYTSNKGLIQLRRDLSRFIQDRDGIVYNPDSELLITMGVSEGLDLALRAILNPGDEVIMPDPCYVAYDACTRLAGGVAIKIPTYEEYNFILRAGDIEQRITPRTRAILIGYPANPTGTVMDKSGLMEIAELAMAHDLLVISDEIYRQIVYGVEHTCFATLPGMKDRTIILNGFSKIYSMTGWRVGYAAANPEIIGAMTKIHQYTALCAPIMSQNAAIEALKQDKESVQTMVTDYNRRRMFMVNGLREIGLSCFEPRGAFYAFPSISVTGMLSEEFAERLLTEEKIAVVPGTAFGESGEGYIRCCYAIALKDIEVALKRMKTFIERYRTT